MSEVPVSIINEYSGGENHFCTLLFIKLTPQIGISTKKNPNHPIRNLLENKLLSSFLHASHNFIGFLSNWIYGFTYTSFLY